MKKKLMAVSVIALILSLLGAGTLAYFTAEDTAHNVITSGGVDIHLQEWANEARTEPFVDPDGVMPGTSFTKVVEIENTGVSDAWVRIRLDRSLELKDPPAGAEGDSGLMELNIDTANWTHRTEMGRDYYYYNKPLKPGLTTEPLFTSVTFGGEELGNLYQNCVFTLDVKAYAVQTANNGTTALDARGWPIF